MKFSKLPSFVLPLILSIIFFIIAFLTLKSYGPSWDETIHFRRGQAYLRYYLTGEKDYKNLPPPILQGTNGNPSNVPEPRRSLYQSDYHNAEYFLKLDVGHPPLNDELAASLNYIFYQKLGIMDDISSHHLFNIISSSILVFAITYFAIIYLGIFPSLIVFLSLVTYPLFFAEAHFNIKDPAETAFFSMTILSTVLFIKRKSMGWAISFSIFLALSLGTKFNVLFLPFILLPFLYVRREDLKFKKKLLLALLILPIISLLIFFLSWPYLWFDPINRIINIFSFYKEIGTGIQFQPESFYLFGFNTYPIQWIIFTTPPLVLLLTLFGILSVWVNKKMRNGVTLLWFLWLVVPILRVSMPGTSLYGGIRQIMEFIPALALLTGLGVWQILEWFRSKKIKLAIKFLILLAFIFPILILFKLHPYQNVYFNFLIGGLQGAQTQNFPSWGNSFGSAYKEGIEWINANAPKDSKLALVQGTPSNAPPILLRKDINYLVNSDINSNLSHFSGFERQGEYLMELTFGDNYHDFYFAWEYINNVLEPVYQVKVENVAILTIWKNDLEHTKEEKKVNETLYKGKVDLIKEGNVVNIQLAEEQVISHFQINLNNEQACLENLSAVVDTSLDKTNWVRERSVIPEPQVYRRSNIEGNVIDFYMAGKKAKYVRIYLNKPNTCSNPSDAAIYVLR